MLLWPLSLLKQGSGAQGSAVWVPLNLPGRDGGWGLQVRGNGMAPAVVGTEGVMAGRHATWQGQPGCGGVGGALSRARAGPATADKPDQG